MTTLFFEKGNWDGMEAELLNHQPAIGVPVVPKHWESVFGFGTANRFIPFLQFQPFQFNDEQFLAFHKDVVRDKLVLPYVEEFDHLSWWCTCKIQQILIQYFYYPYCIQFNHFIIRNDIHRHYQTGEFKSEMQQWFTAQLKKPVSYLHMLTTRLMVNHKDLKNLVIHPHFLFEDSFQSNVRHHLSNTV